MPLDHALADDVAVRQSRMADADLRPAGAGRAAAPDGTRSELAARQQRARMAISVRVVAVASKAPIKLDLSSSDPATRAAVEEMTLADFANLSPARLADLADELQSIIAAGGGR